jgi:hypothetical protein
MAKAIVPMGTLYAVDMDERMLDHVAGQAREADITNLRTLLGGIR